MTQHLDTDTDTLRALLTDVAETFTDGEPVDVRIEDGNSYADPTDSAVVVSPDRIIDAADRSLTPAEARTALALTVGHLATLLTEEPADGKGAFVDAAIERYDYDYDVTLLDDAADSETADETPDESDETDTPDVSLIAGFVWNIVADARARWLMLDRLPEQRNAASALARTMLAARDSPSDADDREHRLLEGLVHLAASGTVPEYETLAEDERRFFAWARRQLNTARRNDDPEVRTDIARRLTDAVLALAGHPDADLPEYENALASPDLLTADDPREWYGRTEPVPTEIPTPTFVRDAETRHLA